jgi:hypothetical protein
MLALPLAAAADSVNVVINGSFEEEFILGIASGWTGFDNGGLAQYGYHDDTWSPVVYDGAHSQLLEVNTKDYGGSENDRYMGIYQVVKVVAASRYMLTFYGMVRSTEGTELDSKYNYRVQLGLDYAGGTDPWAVSEWIEMPWREFPRLSPGRFEGYAHGITTTSDRLTIFIRVWKKFGTPHQEGDINLDAVTLVGPDPAAAAPAASAPSLPATGGGGALPMVGVAAGAAVLGLGGLRLARQRRRS